MLRLERYVEIQVLKRQGKSIRAISAELGVSRNTVRKYLRSAKKPKSKQRPERISKLEPFAITSASGSARRTRSGYRPPCCSARLPSAGRKAQDQIESDKPDSIKVVMRRATARTWKHLAKERLEDVKPTIPRGERFWPLTKEENRAIKALFENDEAVRKLVTSLKSRSDDARIEALDAAYWMKGCSSLGRLRFAVLLQVGKGKKRDAEFCLIDSRRQLPLPRQRHRGR
jgi:hypothetical protein